jgi:4-hydroxy-3-methylbut-2-en-1-yl diphosphate reductase
MKQFEVPVYYRSGLIGKVKQIRKERDPRKKDFSPSVLDFGSIQVMLARHFGFCYGVENAIEIAHKALEENPGKRIFLLSQMIHNQLVNEDLEQRGMRFIMDTSGRQLIPWDEIKPDDVVIIPAFGTTIEIEELLKSKGVRTESYDTTCPFVEKVWNRSAKLGEENFTIVIHGKPNHEETRATFSHSRQHAPALVVKDMEETLELCAFIKGERTNDWFFEKFDGRFSPGFDPVRDLAKIGVVNQTTMLASDTQAIADVLKTNISEKYGEATGHFADTRDTLCYATNDNQQATYGLLEKEADLAIVVGGYNSSNTSHLVDLCAEKVPTYFINSETEIVSESLIRHFDYHSKEHRTTENFLPAKRPLQLILTGGASCPDALVERVLQRILGFFEISKTPEQTVEALSRC